MRILIVYIEKRVKKLIFRFSKCFFSSKTVHWNYLIFTGNVASGVEFFFYQNRTKFSYLAQKQRFFGIFLEIRLLQFTIFCLNLVSGVQKMTDSLFWRILKNYPFWSKLIHILPKFDHISLYQACRISVQKMFPEKSHCFTFSYFLSKKTVSGEKIHILPLWK